MKKLLSLIITAAIMLTACGGQLTVTDVTTATVETTLSWLTAQTVTESRLIKTGMCIHGDRTSTGSSGQGTQRIALNRLAWFSSEI